MKKIMEIELEKDFNDFIDDSYEPVKILNYEYNPSRALERVDSIAYRRAFLEWLDREITEGNIKSHDNGNFYTYIGDE